MTTTATPAVLQPGATLGTSAGAIITAAANTTDIIKRAVFSNPTGAAVTFTVYRVPSGGSISTGAIVISARSIAAGGTDLAPELSDMVLNAGDSIEALASAASSINAFASGFVTS